MTPKVHQKQKVYMQGKAPMRESSVDDLGLNVLLTHELTQS